MLTKFTRPTFFQAFVILSFLIAVTGLVFGLLSYTEFNTKGVKHNDGRIAGTTNKQATYFSRHINSEFEGKIPASYSGATIFYDENGTTLTLPTCEDGLWFSFTNEYHDSNKVQTNSSTSYIKFYDVQYPEYGESKIIEAELHQSPQIISLICHNLQWHARTPSYGWKSVS